MPDPTQPGTSSLPQPISSSCRVQPVNDKVLCERCGAEMFRMHAVWRCPQCRFKTDCCGW